MSARKYVIACLVLTAVALVWNGFLHLIVLRAVDARVRHLFRPDLGSRVAESVLLTVAITALFVLGYSRYSQSGRALEGAQYGFFFGVLAGVLVDANQYILYPIPGDVALLWFCGGLLEFTIYGVIVSRLIPPRPRRSDGASS
jgi:hypothetical protein